MQPDSHQSQRFRGLRSRRRRRHAAFLALPLLAAALAFDPAAILAGGSQPAPAAEARREQVLQRVLNDIESSRAVICSFQDPSGASIVLWARDEANPGAIDPSEVVVIAHRPRLRTLILYEHDDQVAPMSEQALDLSDEAGSLAWGAALQSWMLQPHVRSRILAADVSDLAVESIGPAGEGQEVLRITLTWGGDSADVAERVAGEVRAARIRPTSDRAGRTGSSASSPAAKELRK